MNNHFIKVFTGMTIRDIYEFCLGSNCTSCPLNEACARCFGLDTVPRLDWSFLFSEE